MINEHRDDERRVWTQTAFLSHLFRPLPLSFPFPPLKPCPCLACLPCLRCPTLLRLMKNRPSTGLPPGRCCYGSLLLSKPQLQQHDRKTEVEDPLHPGTPGRLAAGGTRVKSSRMETHRVTIVHRNYSCCGRNVTMNE